MLEKIKGRHVIAEFIKCHNTIINNKEVLLNIVIDGCLKGNAGILGSITHQFEPQGITIIVGLSESHCSLHTWPEENYIMADVVTCGNHVNPRIILDYIHEKIGGKYKLKEFDRGIPFEEDTIGLPEPL